MENIRGSTPLAPQKGPVSRRFGRGVACCLCFCAVLCLFLVCLIISVGIATLMIWLVLHPHSPHFTIESVQVPTLQVIQPPPAGSDKNQTSALVDVDIIFSIEATNPNRKIRIYYEVINVYTLFSGTQIGQTTQVPAFIAGHQNTTFLVAEVKAQNFPVTPSVSTSLLSQIALNAISLQTHVDVKTKVKFGIYKSFSFWVHSHCDIIVTPPTSSHVAGHLQSPSCRMLS